MNNEQLARKYYLVFGNNPVSIDEWDILVFFDSAYIDKVKLFDGVLLKLEGEK